MRGLALSLLRRMLQTIQILECVLLVPFLDFGLIVDDIQKATLFRRNSFGLFFVFPFPL